jgi:hypothetical protein
VEILSIMYFMGAIVSLSFGLFAYGFLQRSSTPTPPRMSIPRVKAAKKRSSEQCLEVEEAIRSVMWRRTPIESLAGEVRRLAFADQIRRTDQVEASLPKRKPAKKQQLNFALAFVATR